MARKRIFSVGVSLPGEEFEYVEFDSNQTLLDADIVLFEPTLGSVSTEHDYSVGGSRLYAGVPVLTEQSSFVAKKQIDHWRSEIVAAVDAGRLVIVFLAKPVERYRYTGDVNYSGTGKSRVGSRVVVPISSYGAVPILRKAIPKSGTSVRLEKDGSYLATYWSDFSDHSSYEVEIEGEFSKVLLRSSAGNRVVGAATHRKAGTLLFLPPVRYDEELFLRDAEEGEDEHESYWTEDGLKFGKRLMAAIVGLADTLKASSQMTAPPAWSLVPEYRLGAESKIDANITALSAEVDRLQAERALLERQLANSGELRALLFEQGKPLERVVSEVMKLFGFEAQPFADGNSEFDVVFASGEGRCLGEVEGKDNRA